MKFNFRKITSALASTAVLGSTVALAAAANFPAPFVQNGAADVAIVYGNTLDLGALIDISTSLSSALAGSGGDGAPASNDAYPLFTSSTPIQLNNSLSSVRSSVTDSNLPNVLGDMEFSGNVEAEAQFKIVLGSNPRVIFAKEPTSSFDPSIGMLYGTTAGTYLYNATVTFDEAVNFTHADSEGEEISLFGQSFTVSSATSDTKLVLFKSAETLSLSVGSATSVPSQTVEVEGETYTVTLVAASDTAATIEVTNSAGQSDRKEINEASSKKILGVEVAVNLADESTATNVIQAEILVGANRLTFQDGSEVKVGTDEKAIEGTQIDFETSGTYPGNLTKLTIQVFADESSDDFFKVGNEFVDPVFGSFRLVFDSLSTGLESTDDREEIIIKPSGTDMASITFTSWEGETLSNWEFLNNKTSGRSGVWLGDSNDWEFEVAEMARVNQSGSTVLGNQDEGLLIEVTGIQNGSTGFGDDYIEVKNLVTGVTKRGDATSEGSGTIDLAGNSYTFSYIKNSASDGGQYVRFNQPDSTGSSMILFPTIETSKGANLAFYEPITINLTSWDGTNGLLGSNAMFPDGDGYTSVALANAGGLHNFTVGSSLAVNTTAAPGASSAVATVGVLTYNFTSTGNVNETTVYLMDSGAAITRPAIVLFEEKDEADVYNTLIVEVTGAGVSDNGVSVSEASFSWNSDNDMKGTAYGSTGFQTEANDKVYQKLDQWGTMVETDQSDSDQYIMTISYPEAQTVAMVYIDSLVEGGSKSLGDVKVMDEELASSGMSSKNLIVVGGSCVNTAASTLLGGSAGCGASWTAATGAGSGEWIIQTFANPWASSKVATLVAGWEQGDTANAATYLKTQNPKTDLGHKLTGTTATAATVVTA